METLSLKLFNGLNNGSWHVLPRNVRIIQAEIMEGTGKEAGHKSRVLEQQHQERITTKTRQRPRQKSMATLAKSEFE
jgi:hypothetical protein